MLKAKHILYHSRQLVTLDVVDHVDREVPIPLAFREAGPRILPWVEADAASGAVVTNSDVPHCQVDVRASLPSPGRDREDFKPDLGVAGRPPAGADQPLD